ncbi:MAG TPA: hypothetical protein PKA64_04435 [Myxococcota bacterium]|nr:hypothetical protein [Myxococcota bacterium]
MRTLPVAALLALAACSQSGVIHTYPIPELTLEVTSPTYGEFAGARAKVTGKVSHPDTVVRVEGDVVEVDDDGTFSTRVPFTAPYRIIDVSADLYGQHAEQRIPVFEGTDPRLSWPGGMSARLTSRGVDGLAGLLRGTAESLLSEQVLLAALPALDLGGTTLGVDSVTRSPVDVTLTTSPAGIAAHLQVKQLSFHLLAEGELLFIPFSIPADLTFPKISIDSLITTRLDTQGQAVLVIGDPQIGFDTPTVSISAVGFGWLSDLLLGWLDIGQVLTDVIGLTVGDLAPIPLGAPIELPADLLGASLEIRTNAVLPDDAGVGVALGVGIDAPAPTTGAPVGVPDGAFADPVDLAIAVHEGMLQPILDSDLLALIEQDLMLPSFLGAFIGNLAEQLPGGDQAPDAYGWCVGIETGDAKVARFRQGAPTLLGVYLPDATVTFGTFEQGDSRCDDWLVASLALEVTVDVTDGTVIGFDIQAPEGKVLSYGATGVDGDAVVAELGGTLSSLLGLLGGLVQLDLNDLLGTDQLLADAGSGLGIDLSSISPEIRGAQPVLGADGEPVDGLWEIGVQLFR